MEFLQEVQDFQRKLEAKEQEIENPKEPIEGSAEETDEEAMGQESDFEDLEEEEDLESDIFDLTNLL